MTLRTFAWFYGADYELINIHAARNQKDRYYADPELYGAMDVISLTTHNTLKTVRQITVRSPKPYNPFEQTVYIEGTSAWYKKFEDPARFNAFTQSWEIFEKGESFFGEDYVEHSDGWFECELPLGFASVYLFEYLTTHDYFTERLFREISFKSYLPAEDGKLTLQFQHTFQSCQVKRFKIINDYDEESHHRIYCQLSYGTHIMEYFDGGVSPRQHEFVRVRLYDRFDKDALLSGKARVEVARDYVQFLLGQERFAALAKTAKKMTSSLVAALPTKKEALTLHQIVLSENTKFYEESVSPGELDSFFFFIAPRRYEHAEFIEAVYEDATTAHIADLRKVNPHLKNTIEPGQIVYVMHPESSVYYKFKQHLDRSAKRIEQLRLKNPESEAAFFSEYFALMGSFSESVGYKAGEFAATESTVFGKLVGTVTEAGNVFYREMKRQIEAITDDYEKKPAFKELRADALKEMDRAAVQMLDSLVRKKNITSSMIFDESLRMRNRINHVLQRWTVTATRLVPLDQLYDSVQKVDRVLKASGPVLIYLDFNQTRDKIAEACTKYREEECRFIQFDEWGGFLGRTAASEFGSRAIGAGTVVVALALAPETGGLSLAVVAAASSMATSGMVQDIGDKGGREIARVFYEYAQDNLWVK